MRRIVLAFLLLCAALGPAAAQQRLALVIGNDAYRGLPRLERAAADADLMGQTLRNIGFDATVVRDADRRAMSRAFESFRARIRPGDTVFLFFAGHGVEVNGSNYLLPIDIPDEAGSQEGILRDEAFATTETIRRLRQAGARTLVAVLDACRNDPFAVPGRRSIAGTRGLAREPGNEGVFVVFSAGEGQTALDRLGPDDQDPNSVFTRVFAKRLGEPGRPINEIVYDIRQTVAALAATRGHQQRPAFYDDTLERLVLVPAAIGPIPGPPATIDSSKPPPVFGFSPIKIAVAGPMTGSYAFFGQQMKEGAEQAVEDINAAGGVNGRRLVLQVADDACDPRQAVTVANGLAGQKVGFVAGHFCSGSSIPAAAVYAKTGIVQISPASTHPRLTDERAGPSIFRVAGRDDHQGRVAGKFIAESYRGKNVAIVHDKSAYGKSVADDTRRAMNAAGLKEKIYETITTGEKDYSALASKLKSANIDLLYFGGYHTEAALVTRALRAQGARTVVVAGDALATDEFWAIAGSAGQGTLMTFSPDARKASGVASLVERFRARKIEPEGYVLYTYAAVQVYAEAVRRAGSMDADEVTTALSSGEFSTVLGTLRFDRKGDVTLPSYVLYRWDAGKWDMLAP